MQKVQAKFLKTREGYCTENSSFEIFYGALW